MKLLMILISLRAILQMTQSYTSRLRPYMPAFKILIELILRIPIGLVIGSLIITKIRVYTHSLIRGLISRKYSYSLYYRAAYPKQQLCPPYNQASVISIILQLITIGRFKWALAPPHCGLILMERQELASYILLLFCLLSLALIASLDMWPVHAIKEH